jgi:hypothetical protein
MLRKRGWAFLVLCASLLLAVSASATVTYTFTSDDGDFAFTSPSFFEGGSIPGPGGMVISHSGNFDAVRFGASDIVLLNSTCEFDGNCFDATFLEDGIFQKTGTFFASDGDAKIVIADSSAGAPVPELSTWALLAIGLAGLGFARNRRVRGVRTLA